MNNLLKYYFVITITLILPYTLFSQCYQLIWAEEFNYSGLPDANWWTFETGGHGWGNNELQYHTNRIDNAEVKDTMLVITAKKENYNSMQYTSARIVTMNKFDFRYGKIEARMKLPYGQGIWPAFWMLGSNFSTAGWPGCGEIDIMEMVGGTTGDKTVHGTAHWDNAGNHAMYGGSKTLSSGIFADKYHIFSLEWDAQKIVWKFDGIQYHIIDITPGELSEFHNKYFIILNLAVGGNWPGSPDANTVFPQTLEVDYIRVYSNIDYLTIEGKQLVDSAQENLIYSVPYIEGAVYNWTIPENITLVNSDDSGQITVNWGNTAETLKCEVITSCGTKEIELFVNVKEISDVVKNSFQNHDVIIYPNPFTNTFKISENIQIQSYNIIDITGNTIGKSINPDNLICLKSLPSGFYIISIEDIYGKFYFERIIKK